MKKKSAAENLSRLLNLVPLIYANPGMPLGELQKISGFPKREELTRALDRLMMFGIPPFSPADLIEIFIDDEDRVFLNFPQGLERPIDLTPEEWVAVERVIRSELEFHTTGRKSTESLKSILGRISSIPMEFEASNPHKNRRALTEEAMQDRLQLEFKYRTLSSKEPEIRRVDPWAVFEHRGVAYLIAHCHLRNAPRYFHLERMEEIEILDLPQTTLPPKDLVEFSRNSPIFSETPEGISVEIAFAPELRSTLEHLLKITDLSPFPSPHLWDEKNETTPSAPVTDAEKRDWYRAKCKVREGIWFRATLRGLGPEVIILSPRHMRDSYLAELEEIEIPAPLV